ncbi:MAG TPA: APH(3') family aminoglycoside O-phosphotransferase [Pyrinomonadaceae bacterium]|nr:APH(3') family aminoglycoside O-phosphotransferase [Pyrinomonadaceae bacterium]
MKNLPANLSRILQNQTLERNIVGFSNSEVYWVKNSNAFLKVADKNSVVNLRREKEILEWLSGKISGPKVLHFEETGEKTFLLISKIKEINSADSLKNLKAKENLINDLAKSLKRIHSISTKNCPFQQTLHIKLQNARENVEKGLVDEEDFEDENNGKSTEALFYELIESKPDDEDLVFTHGDFCFPNIIVSDEKVSGFIDWERGGIADRYQDIALLFRSFNFNVGDMEQFEDLFCNCYGIEKLNREKIKFYITLDEFF